MSFTVPSNHPIVTTREKIEEITNNFLHDMGFSYFQYLRCYADGSIGLLSNKSDRFCTLASRMPEGPAVFSSMREEYANLPNYWFLWDEELPSEPVGLVGNFFQAWNGLTLVKRYKNHYDMIAVALAAPTSHVGSFYMNKLGAIEHFVSKFEQRHRNLLKAMDDHPLILSKPYQDINVGRMCLNKGRTVIHTQQNDTYLTQQERKCLQLISHGHTYKRVAQLLGISTRSVETYIKRIKVRTGLNTRDDVKEILNCPDKKRTY